MGPRLKTEMDNLLRFGFGAMRRRRPKTAHCPILLLKKTKTIPTFGFRDQDKLLRSWFQNKKVHFLNKIKLKGMVFHL
jgi:hypothetical protein